MYTFRYMCRHTYMSDVYVCVYVRVNICMYIHICPCMYIKSTPLSLHINLIYVTKEYGCHIANMTYTAIMLKRHINPTFLHTCLKTQKTATDTSYVIVLYVS